MLIWCFGNSVSVVDLSSFDFSSVTSMRSFSTGTSPQLIRLDNATFSHFSTINGLIYYNTNEMTVVFKNEEEKNNFLNKNTSSIGSKTEFLTVDEYNTKYPNGKEII